MKDQIEEAFRFFGEELTGSVPSSVTKKLMTVNPDAIQLNNNKNYIFYLVTEKLLFIIKRVRSDCEAALSFLTTRLLESNEDDWENLRSVLLWCTNIINDV